MPGNPAPRRTDLLRVRRTARSACHRMVAPDTRAAAGPSAFQWNGFAAQAASPAAVPWLGFVCAHAGLRIAGGSSSRSCRPRLGRRRFRGSRRQCRMRARWGPWRCRGPLMPAAWSRRRQPLTGRPFSGNLVLEWDQHRRLDQALGAGLQIVSLTWGDPAPYVAPAHDAGALVSHTVSSAEEARLAVACGVDVIVAQGWEAGGHVRGDLSPRCRWSRRWWTRSHRCQ